MIGDVVNAPDLQVKREVDAMFTSAELASMIRYQGKKFWEAETIENDYCTRLRERVRGDTERPRVRLESVADHSWHVADIVGMLAPRFSPPLDIEHCISLAILHDKLEIWARDVSPLGKDGSGRNTFAFNEIKRLGRDIVERRAAERYLSTLNSPARAYQAAVLQELLEDETECARFVRAIDKLQVFVFLITRKMGDMHDTHIDFNIRYARKYVERAPMLYPHYLELVERLLLTVAEFRRIPVRELKKRYGESVDVAQPDLPLAI
jgi:5'-deoxynucleotidase YfbR-like HD superfamily hydrolase